MKLILVRHGESQWNLENRFTGWEDVSLTEEGIKEAKFAAKQINKEKLIVNSIHTSILKRAIDSANIIADNIGYEKNKIIKDWHINERHYGALQGLNKSETAEKYGEDQVHIWRRSFDIPPPLLSEDDIRHPKNVLKFKEIPILPIGESLKDVIKRLTPFWESFKSTYLKDNLNHLIVAHSNSLRAIVMILENLTVEEILNLNIPTGVPIVYEIDSQLNILSKKILLNKEELEKRNLNIINQGKKNE